MLLSSSGSRRRVPFGAAFRSLIPVVRFKLTYSVCKAWLFVKFVRPKTIDDASADYPSFLRVFLVGCGVPPAGRMYTAGELFIADPGRIGAVGCGAGAESRYQQWRQEQADELRGRIDCKAPTAEQAEPGVRSGAGFRDFRSRLFGLLRRPALPLAERSGSRYERRLALLADIDVWLGRGQTSYAEAIFRKIGYRRYDSA